MISHKDVELLLRWACLDHPGGVLAYVDTDPSAPPPPFIHSSPLMEAVNWTDILSPGAVPPARWRGLYLKTDAASLDAQPALPASLRSFVRGPVLIRLTDGAPSTRETWDRRFIEAGWLRHPLILSAADFTALESECGNMLLAYLPLNDAVIRAHPLAALAAERALHMDMLREAGRRSDAHLARYTWALDFIRPNDRVVDAACGLGYGSAIIRAGSPCGSVLGLDVSDTAITYARHVYAASWRTLSYETCDLSDLSSIPDDSVDCLISFETFEHLEYPRAFAGEVRRILKPGGRLLCSVPNYWADATGRDPSPYHLHTFDLPLLLSICGGFRVESLVGQCAGGTDPRFSAKRRFEQFEPDTANSDPRATGVEWWILAAMKDPLTPGRARYRETVFPALNILPDSAQYVHAYQNPWVVHALVHIPFRLKSPSALVAAARDLAESTQPGSADHGAALAVLAYHSIGSASVARIGDREAISRAVHAHLAVEPSQPHEHRWRISLAFALGQISLSLGRRAQARAKFEQCAALDFRQFSPHIATKTAEAAFQAGRLALYEADFPSAQRCFERGLAIGRQLNQVPLEEILIDPQQPHLHGWGDGMREYVLALDNVTRCANGLAIIDRYKKLGQADISAMDRSWQWEVGYLADELRSSVADSKKRLEQVRLLTTELQKFEGECSALRSQITQLTQLASQYERESADRNGQITRLTELVRQLETESANRAAQITRLTELVRQHETESANRAAQIKQLTDLIKPLEQNTAERMKQIEAYAGWLKEAESKAADAQREVESYAGWLKDAKRDIELITAAHRSAEKTVESLTLQNEQDAAGRAAQLDALTKLVQEQELTIQRQAAQIRQHEEISATGAISPAMPASEILATELRRTRFETALAARLLGEIATLPVSAPAKWVQLPTIALDETPPRPVRSHLETADFGPHLVRISGWGFAEVVNAMPVETPCLLFAGPNALWILRGQAVERPDVEAAFPDAGTAAARRRSGFVFEFHPGQLPTPALRDFRIICGQIAGEPVMTPPSNLP